MSSLRNTRKKKSDNVDTIWTHYNLAKKTPWSKFDCSEEHKSRRKQPTCLDK